VVSCEWTRVMFLPTTMPKGRQCIFIMESMARCHGGFTAPSGDVLDEDEVLLTWRYGPNQIFHLLVGVLFVSARDQFVIICLSWFCKKLCTIASSLIQLQGTSPVLK
jgi:hypothetical protein